MILDTLKNRDLYPINNIDLYLEWVDHRIKSPLEAGREELEKGAYALICFNETAEEIGQFETHEQFIDVHIVISGSERIAYAPIENLIEAVAYQADKDFALYTGDNLAHCTLNEGMFMVLFPGEGHIPNIRSIDSDTSVCKIVLKIPIHAN